MRKTYHQIALPSSVDVLGDYLRGGTKGRNIHEPQASKSPDNGPAISLATFLVDNTTARLRPFTFNFYSMSALAR